MSDDPQILLRKVVQLEHLAYSAVLRAFKAQGDNNWHKQQVLESLRHYLFISPERHQAEMLRLDTDPLLNRVSSFLQKETVDRAALSSAAVTEGVNMNGDDTATSSLSALVESDTDSASDYSESKNPKKNKTKKTTTPKKQKTTGNKRGRKPKVKPEETDEQPVAKRPRGRPKGSGKGSTRRKNKHAFSQQSEQLKAEAASSSSAPVIPAFDIVIDPNMSVEEMEAVAEKVDREIGDLEGQLLKPLETHHREKIMEEVKIRREYLVQLVQQLEKALEEDEDEPVTDAHAPVESTPNEPQDVQQPPESTPVNS